MDLGAAKEKQEGEKDAKAKATDTDKKTSANKSDAARDELIKFMREHYEDKVQHVETFDDLYHAIYELIEMFCEHNGQFQYRIPSKEDLEREYKKVQPKRGGGNLSQAQFEKIATGLVKVNSFSFGRAAVQMLAILFGLPVCAVYSKRFIPGLRSVSDDIVIPVATSGAVVYLAKTKKL